MKAWFYNFIYIDNNPNQPKGQGRKTASKRLTDTINYFFLRNVKIKHS